MQPFLRSFLLLTALLAVAVLLRAPGLGFHSLWVDEASTANVVLQKNLPDLYKVLATFEGTPPLFYAVEKCFVALSGQTVNAVSLRFLPMIFGALSCVLCFLLFRRLGGTKTALASFFLLASSSFHIYLSIEARSYSLLGFLSLLTLLAAVRWFDKPGFGRGAVLCAAVALTVQAHFYALLWIAAIACCGLLLHGLRDRRSWRFALLMVIPAAVSFLPLLPLFLSQMQNEVGSVRANLTMNWLPGIVYVPVKIMIGAYLFKIREVKDLTAVDYAGIVPVLIILAAAGWLWIGKWRQGGISLTGKLILSSVALAFLLHVVAGSRVPTVHPRYMAHFLVLLFGLVLGAAADRKTAGVLAFCALLGLNAVGNYHFFKRSNFYIEPWDDIARIVDSAVRERGDSCATVVGDSYPVAFYSSLAKVRFYAMTPLLPPEKYIRTTLFGHEYFCPRSSPKEGNRLYTVAGAIPFADVVRERRCGILVSKDRDGRVMQENFRRLYGSIVETQTVSVVRTNQGDISILKWWARFAPAGP